MSDNLLSPVPCGFLLLEEEEEEKKTFIRQQDVSFSQEIIYVERYDKSNFILTNVIS